MGALPQPVLPTAVPTCEADPPLPRPSWTCKIPIELFNTPRPRLPSQTSEISQGPGIGMCVKNSPGAPTHSLH